MRRLLFLLLLTAQIATAYGQTITELPVWRIYPGVIAEKTLFLPKEDSSRVVTAMLYYDKYARLLLAPAIQPTVTKTGGRVLIQWSSVVTGTGSQMPPSSYLRIAVGGVVRFGVPINISTLNANTTDPKSLTVLYPVAITLPDSGVPEGEVGRTKQYQYMNAIPGTIIIHNQRTRYVNCDAFQDDTGQRDPLWRVDVSGDNSVILRGPPGEVFTGTLILTFYKQTNSQ